MRRRPRRDDVQIPVELRGVATVDEVLDSAPVPARTRPRASWFSRATDTRQKLSTTSSRRLRLLDDALVAAAMVMDPNAVDAPLPNAVTRTWQHAAYGYVNTVPELNAGRMYVGNALSRCTLAVGKRNPDGSVEQGFEGIEPVEGLDKGVAEEAAEIIASIRSKKGGQSELLRSSGEKMFVAGELYYLPEDDPSGDATFEVLSTQELLRDGAQWTRYLGPGYGAVPIPQDVSPIRVWRPDGQWSMLATSSVRSCLEILEELLVLTRLVRSSAISRMALAGVLAIPDELDTPDDEVGMDGQQSEATSPLAVDMINTGAKAIDDPANAATWMPYVIQGPAEWLSEIRHIPFEAANQQQVIERTEALQRLAQGLDLPVEVILGHMSTTFTNAQQISIDTFRIHLEPTLSMISDALTVAALWPRMAKNRGIDAEHLAAGEPLPDDVLSVAVTYDAHDLISVPDRFEQMVDVYTRDATQQTIKISEMRDALNLDPEEIVATEEVATRIDALRLQKIREVINAPPDEAAVSIAQARAGKATIPGSSEGEALIEAGERGTSTASAAGGFAARVAGALDLTVARAIERLGAKLRSKGNPQQRAAWKDVPNETLAIQLGPQQVQMLLGTDAVAAVRVEAATLARRVTAWAEELEMPHPSVAGRRAGEIVVRLVETHAAGQPLTLDMTEVASIVLGGLEAPVPVG